MKINYKDIVVYTCLIGEHEGLNKQPQIKNSKIRHVCLTDDKNLKSSDWEILFVNRIFPADAHRSQRYFKIKPHLFFPDYEYSLYIDNTVVLKKNAEIFIEMVINDCSINLQKPFLSLPYHSFRDDLLSEFNECSNLKLDKQIKIYNQLIDYSKVNINLLKRKPYWAGILFRNHNNSQLINFSEIWFANLCKYSKRDQLSIMYSANQAELTISGFNLNNALSEFHKWPVKNLINKQKAGDENLLDSIPFNLLANLSKKIKTNEEILNKINKKRNNNFILIFTFEKLKKLFKKLF